jgi:hypothetical protein
MRRIIRLHVSLAALGIIRPIFLCDLTPHGIDQGWLDSAHQCPAERVWLFWQPRFFDRALRTVGEYCEKVEYLHLNPVRAGLVKRAEDWPWSSVHDYTGGAHHPAATPSGLAIDRVLLPADGRTRI